MERDEFFSKSLFWITVCNNRIKEDAVSCYKFIEVIKHNGQVILMDDLNKFMH